ncbi:MULTISPECIES: hypothetical protein [Aeromonas]|uniref:Lipocalin-like domain-containing protein n=1 Tax=Aeromonas media TaxID=651 RepID=A0AAE7AID0_AERME|nr:hypothetical protein [Aeromonas media]QJT31047.1 hypothetical protein E4186_13290 [Aeromonas media]
MKIILAITFFTIATSSLAGEQEEMNKWYMAKSGDYTIRDSINDGIFASLSKTVSGGLNIYIQRYEPEKCKESEQTTHSHEPLNINGTLVKYGQACSGQWRTFFPITSAGTDYVISEFKRKKIVEVTTYDNSFKLLFSANGFVEAFNSTNSKRVAEKNAI